VQEPMRNGQPRLKRETGDLKNYKEPAVSGPGELLKEGNEPGFHILTLIKRVLIRLSDDCISEAS